MLSGIGSILSAVAVAAAAVFGTRALDQNLRQKRSEKQMEVAESILATAYKMQESLDRIRNPMSTAAELDRSEKELSTGAGFAGLTKQQQDSFVQANVFFQRIRDEREAFDEAFEVLPYALTYFGPEMKEQLLTIIRNRQAVSVYAQAFARDRGVDKTLDKTISETLWKGYGDVSSDGDKIARTTTEAIEALEAKLLPLVRPNVSKRA